MASPATKFALKVISFQNWLNPTNDGLAALVGERFITADMIDFLPVPEQSLQGTWPYNPHLKPESKLWRLLLVLPLLSLSVFASQILWAEGIPDVEINRMAADRRVTWDSGSQAIPQAVFHVKWLDDLLSLVAVAFAPSIMEFGPHGAWWQMLSFLTDYGTIYAIFLVEAARRSNIFLPASWSVLSQHSSTHISMQTY